MINVFLICLLWFLLKAVYVLKMVCVFALIYNIPSLMVPCMTYGCDVLSQTSVCKSWCRDLSFYYTVTAQNAQGEQHISRAAAVASRLCVCRRHSGSIKSVGHQHFGSTHNPTQKSTVVICTSCINKLASAAFLLQVGWLHFHICTLKMSTSRQLT